MIPHRRFVVVEGNTVLQHIWSEVYMDASAPWSLAAMYDWAGHSVNGRQSRKVL